MPRKAALYRCPGLFHARLTPVMGHQASRVADRARISVVLVLYVTLKLLICFAAGMRSQMARNRPYSFAPLDQADILNMTRALTENTLKMQL